MLPALMTDDCVLLCVCMYVCVCVCVCAEIRPRQVVLPSSTDHSRRHEAAATTRSTSEEIALDEATASLSVRRHNESGMTSALHPALAVVRPTVSRSETDCVT